MKNDFPRIYISPEIRRKMIEIARELRKAPTKGEKVLWEALRGKKLAGIKFRRQKNLPTALGLIRHAIRSQAQQEDIPSPFMGVGKGGG